eukprot:353849-Chlamydomonas_euryale.AAC.3
MMTPPSSMFPQHIHIPLGRAERLLRNVWIGEPHRYTTPQASRSVRTAPDVNREGEGEVTKAMRGAAA